MNIQPPSRSQELSHYFMVMGLLAAAKAADDVEAVADLVVDLEAISLWSRSTRVRQHAAAEFARASALLVDMQSKRFGYTGPLVVVTGAAEPANLN